MNPSKLLAVVASVFVSMAFVMAIIYYRFQPRWVASFAAVVPFYAALYYRRRRSTHLLQPNQGLRRRLEKAAVALVLFLTGLFFYSFGAPGMPWWVAVGAWLGLAAAAYFLHDVIIFDDEEEEPALELV